MTVSPTANTDMQRVHCLGGADLNRDEEVLRRPMRQTFAVSRSAQPGPESQTDLRQESRTDLAIRFGSKDQRHPSLPSSRVAGVHDLELRTATGPDSNQGHSSSSSSRCSRCSRASAAAAAAATAAPPQPPQPQHH